MLFFASFSYRSRVIVKGVSIIIGISYITIITGEGSWCTDLIEIRDLIPLHVFLMLFQFVLKHLL